MADAFQLEGRFRPATITEARLLRRVLQLMVSTGCVPELSTQRSQLYADAVTGWLIGTAPEVGAVGRASRTLAKYRRVLVALEQRMGEQPAGEPLALRLSLVAEQLEQLQRAQLERAQGTARRVLEAVGD